jgi:hypothetical protein
MLTISYYENGKKKTIKTNADCVTISIPEQKEYEGQADWYLPPLDVTVNTDAIAVHHEPEHERLHFTEYSDLLGIQGKR